MIPPRVLLPVLQDCIAAAVARLRGGHEALPSDPWRHTDTVDAEGLGLKSLELIGVAGEVADRFGLREAGVEDYLLRRRGLGDWARLIAEHGLKPTTTLSFFTSGSTGAPVACRHSMIDLIDEVEAVQPLLGAVRRVRLLVPAHHIYGFLWGYLMPGLMGLPVLPRNAPPEPFRAGDLIVSYPDHWRFLAGGEAALPQGLTGLPSTAPMSTAVAQALTARGLDRLIEIYGSSQTAGVGWRQGPEDPFTLLQVWQTPALDGYDRPAALIRARSGRPAPVQDHLVFDAPRQFRVQGRRDQAIMVSGLTVYPERVRAQLESHQAVTQARVRLDRDGALAALIVPADPAVLGTPDRQTALVQTLSTWCSSQLAGHERPMRWRVMETVPMGPMGKERDWTS